MADLLTIGELSARSGVATSALRFYDRTGLIRSARTAGNQRRYQRVELRRVAFIRIAQQVGISLEEIRSALAELPAERTPTRADWARLSAHWRAPARRTDRTARGPSGPAVQLHRLWLPVTAPMLAL